MADLLALIPLCVWFAFAWRTVVERQRRIKAEEFARG